MLADQQLEQKNQMIWFDSERFNAVTDSWFSGYYWQQRGQLTGQSKGRGTTYFFVHQGNEYVLRHYIRGGVIGKFIHDSYWYGGLSRTRVWQELQFLLQLDELGLPVPKPAAARVSKRLFCYRGDIILHKIPAANDVHQLLCRAPLSQCDWQNIGKTIRQFHNMQVFHHDLNIHNIMLDSNQKVWLIDFDKCGLKRGESWKQKNLDRLFRSLNKEQTTTATYYFKLEDWQHLLLGYQS